MKYIFSVLSFFLLITISCSDNKSPAAHESSTLPFAGHWERSFMLGVDSLEYVYYNIWEDSIEYIMDGPLPLNYVMQRDTFLLDDNRWIGKLHDVYFVMFVKNYSADSIAIFKQQFDTRQEAITRPYPADTVSGHFSSWYTFYRKK